jgi:hypothetical protein
VVDEALVLRGVPYVTPDRTVAYGDLVSDLSVADGRTQRPSNHTVWFTGQNPSDHTGARLNSVIIDDTQAQRGGVLVHHQFSSKPPCGHYEDYYEKMTTYARILESKAQAIEPEVTAQGFPLVEDDAESVFNYFDTASSRAGLEVVREKLRIGPVAIVGCGGTGSYTLDFLAKTPVAEIHLFDADRLLQHNAFRAPGAPAGADFQGQLKVDYLAAIYGKMRRAIVPHGYHVTAENVGELEQMAFVFLALTDGAAKRLIVEKLEQWQIPFIDCGMGIQEVDGALLGQLRVTTSTPNQRGHVHDKKRIPFSDGEAHDDYAQNIQIAELNALNSALAMIKFKKLLGFYHDPEQEHNTIYQLDGNCLINEDTP